MRTILSLVVLPLTMASCTTLPRPVVEPRSANDAEATRLLQESSKRSGDPWQRLRQIEVSYDGEWSKFAERTQPVLVDSGYRKSSTETYTPGLNKVLQLHRGAEGTKRVIRTPENVRVSRNDTTVEDKVELQAAALVADAYTMFTFGSSVLRERGTGWRVIGQRSLNGERCQLVSESFRPGFGMSASDGVIARARRIAAHVLEAAPQTLEFSGGIRMCTPVRFKLAVPFRFHCRAAFTRIPFRV